MTRAIRLTSASVGGLLLMGATIATAQDLPPHVQLVGRTVAVAPGSIHGTVKDDHGAPVPQVVVSALGVVSTFAVTDLKGRFELRALPPGPYVVRAHLSGYAVPAAQLIEVRSNGTTPSAIALHRTAPARVLTAGVAAPAARAAARSAAAAPSDAASGEPQPETTAEAEADTEEIAWRMRTARRGILREATLRAGLAAADNDANRAFGPLESAVRVAESSLKLASNFMTAVPFTGQVNLLTTGAFETPQELFSTNTTSRRIAYVSLSAPAGTNAFWTVRGAMTQADISSWIVAGSYKTTANAKHQHGFSLSYSTQRYDGGNPMTLREVSAGSRNVGEISSFDTLALSPAVSITYGGRYAQYDYLIDPVLLSPNIGFVLKPAAHVRIKGGLSRNALAPGAEEFLAPLNNSGIWLPPQRTFSALEPGRPFEAERTMQANLGLERDFGAATIGFRAFHQRVNDQLMTLFGAELPGQPSSTLGHYFIGSAGDAKATGGAATFETSIGGRVRGSVEYSLSNARLRTRDDLSYVVLVAPGTVRSTAERIQDVSAALETNVPETATHVMVLYRVGNAFTHAAQLSGGNTAARRGLESRFDVQVRQGLPFMDFGTAKWEMLVAVRNFFRDPSRDQSIYDELLVVRPPKRIVGGITMLF